MKSKKSLIKILIIWFVDNKLIKHFGEDKAKSNLFANKRRAKNVRQLNIRYKHINLTQHSQVNILGVC